MTNFFKRKRIRLILIILAILFITVGFIFRKKYIHNYFHEPVSNTKDTFYVPLEKYGIRVDSFRIIEDSVLKNENLSKILSEYHVTPLTISILSDSSRKIFDFRKIRPGNKFMILTGKGKNPVTRYFIYEENIVDFIVCKLDSPMKVYRDHKKTDTIVKSFGVAIDTSLWIDMVSHGATPELIATVADVFAYQIDFFSIFTGDKVKVIYQEVKVEGRPAGIGKILCAWFQHSGEDNYAFYFKRDSVYDYFDQKGNCLRRAFLKAPLKFSFISSGFSRARFHPILHIFTPHTGIDYVAAWGTPVCAVGDGFVVSAGWAGGAGNMVLIRHAGGYVTGYNHLSGYGRGIRRGQRVRQGQIIGYVGTTGLSTGPHLDYRMWKNGVPLNPLRMKFPTMKALEKKYIPEFEKLRDNKIKSLDKIRVLR